MPVIVTICLLAATVALVALALVTIRTMLRFEKVAERIETTAELFCESMIDVKAATREVHELMSSLDEAVRPIHHAAERVAGIADRAAAVSSGLLDELEAPVRGAIGVARGVRLGAGDLLHRISNRWRGRTDGHGRRG